MSSVLLTFIVGITLSYGISIYNGTSCEEDSDLCRLDPDCEPILNAYLSNCSAVLNQTNGTFPYQYGWCPDDCQQRLNDYLLFVYPDEISTSYCTCNQSSCDAALQQLFDQRCIASDCANLWEDCQLDPNCQPLADAYNSTCYPVFSNLTDPDWTYNFCPDGCEAALDAYVSYVAPNYTTLRFCDCNGDDICEQTKDLLESAGCATPDCEDQFEDCLMDPDCASIADLYLGECMVILNGSFPLDYCPDGCQWALQAYIDYVAPNSTTLNFCTCSNENCEEGRNNLLSYGCVASDCTQYYMDCVDDPDCQPIAESYLDNCMMVINGSWTEDWCPTSCSYALATYIDAALTNFSYSSPFDYCDCNGQKDCIEGRQNLYDAGCFAEDCTKLHVTKCVGDPVCEAVHAQYLMDCWGVFNGTDEYCPANCSSSLMDYLPFIANLSDYSDLTAVCDCPPNSDCATYQNNLISAGCLSQGCTLQWAKCQADPDCKPIADQYLIECQQVIGLNYSLTECPANCSNYLAMYIEAASLTRTLTEPDYCDCEGDANCEDIQQFYIDLDCFPENCEYQFSLCEQDADCAPIAAAYLEACSDVFTLTLSGTDQCPATCAYYLSEYLEIVYGNNTGAPSDYCQCSGDNIGCDLVQDELDRLNCTYVDMNDCALNDHLCSLDPVCNQTRNLYFDECGMFLNGTYNESLTVCPEGCAYALQLYAEAVYDYTGTNITEVCDCNGEGMCENITAIYDELGCLSVEASCEVTFGFCLQDPVCAVIATEYLDACGDVLSGALANEDQCPIDCTFWLSLYLEYVFGNETEGDLATDYCQCSAANNGCEDSQAELVRLNCTYLDPNSCQLNDMFCARDPMCNETRAVYFDECQIFLNGSYDGGLTECPAGCDQALADYAALVYDYTGSDVNEVCDCGGEGNCENITAIYSDLGCLGGMVTPDTTASVVNTQATLDPDSAYSIGFGIGFMVISFVWVIM